MPLDWSSCVILLQLFLCFEVLLTGSRAGPNERRLLENLGLYDYNTYNKLERPVVNESEALNVQFGLVLQQIIGVDEKNQILKSNIWLHMEWNDYNLQWNESEYGGIKNIRLPAHLIWKPDVLMYNSADDDIDSTYSTNVVVSSDGHCLWVPPGMYFSTCKIDITWFPFDEQKCTMKFGSWTYDSSGIDLQLHAEGGDLSSFIANGEWELLGLPASRNVLRYDCCPEEYIDITITVHIRRRTLYYGFNLIIPCVLISSMALLAFTLPPDSGEKISLGVTIMLSLTVFLLLVAETMPPTSDAVPLIGMYFACIMMMCSLSVVFTVLVLNFHYRSPGTHRMPKWIKIGICEWLAWILFIRRPTDETGKDNVCMSSSSGLPDCPGSNYRNLSRSNSLVNRRRRFSSRDIVTSGNVELTDVTSVSAGVMIGGHMAGVRDTTSGDKDWSFRRTSGGGLRRGFSTTSGSYSRPYTPTADLAAVAASTPKHLPAVRLLTDILAELRQLTDKVANDEEIQSQINDWRFAAMVIDRLCLVAFTLFTVISTFAILFSGPHVIA